MEIKKKIQPVVNGVEVVDAGSEGQAVAKWNNYVLFIKGAVPGDVVDVKLIRKKKNYAEAEVINYIKLSDKRAKPECEHFGVCGGCKWQSMDYSHQLFYKQKQVSDALKRIGKMAVPEINPIVPSQEIYFYRNKLEYTFSNKLWLTNEQIKSGVEFGNRNARGLLRSGCPAIHLTISRERSGGIGTKLSLSAVFVVPIRFSPLWRSFRASSIRSCMPSKSSIRNTRISAARKPQTARIRNAACSRGDASESRARS